MWRDTTMRLLPSQTISNVNEFNKILTSLYILEEGGDCLEHFKRFLVQKVSTSSGVDKQFEELLREIFQLQSTCVHTQTQGTDGVTMRLR